MKDICKINLRSKTRAGFKNENDLIMSIIESFLYSVYSEDVALDTIWKLMNGESRTLRYFGITLCFPPEKENMVLMNRRQLKMLANEMRYQYMQLHPKAFQKEDQMFRDICEAFENNVIESNIIWEKIRQSSYILEKLERSLYLLSSNRENNKFGGLRNLGLNRCEAEFFMPKCSAIEQIIIKVLSRGGERIDLIPNQVLKKDDKIDFIPNTELKESEDNIMRTEETNNIQYVSVMLGKVVTPQDVIEFSEEFTKLLEALENLENCGFSVESILEKRTKIKKMLEVIEIF